MSNHYQRRLSLAGIDPNAYSDAALRKLVGDLLARGIHGLSFSPYTGGQGPGTRLTDSQIRSRLAIIQDHVEWIRIFSCTDGHELIPAIAAKQGLKCMAGVWLDDDLIKNAEEIDQAIRIANDGHAQIIAVGNEVLLRGELSEQQLVGYIEQVKQSVPAGVEVGYVDAYFEFEDHPAVADACDVILANCYPFWEGCPAEHALLYMKEMYRRAQRAGGGKRVIISETGWPNVGTPEGGAIPNDTNAIRYFINTFQWAEQDGVEVIYFSSFDEAWKVDAEGDVGAYWGLWNAEGQPKFW
ncbi:MAG: glycosyl hydrolase family 17 protein [Pseudomonadota bacterium]